LEILDANSFNKAYEKDLNNILTVLFIKKTEYYCLQNWLSYKYISKSFSVLFSILLIKSTKKNPFILLAFLKEYKNVFDLVKAAKLIDQRGFKHVIKTTGPLLFSPLYNLLRP
jgi:ABC-type sugar transport system permease subunit